MCLTLSSKGRYDGKLIHSFFHMVHTCMHASHAYLLQRVAQVLELGVVQARVHHKQKHGRACG